MKYILIILLLIPLVSANNYVYLEMNGESVGDSISYDVKLNEEITFKASGSDNITTVYLYIKNEDNLVQGKNPTLKWTPTEEKTYELDIIGWVENKRVASQKFYLKSYQEAVEEETNITNSFTPIESPNPEDFFRICDKLKKEGSTHTFDLGTFKIKIGFAEYVEFIPWSFYFHDLTDQDVTITYDKEKELVNLFIDKNPRKNEIINIVNRTTDEFRNEACSAYWNLISELSGVKKTNEEKIEPETPTQKNETNNSSNENLENKCEYYWRGGETTNSLDIGFIPDGYKTSQEFYEDIKLIVDNGIFHRDALGDNKNKINLHYYNSEEISSLNDICFSNGECISREAKKLSSECENIDVIIVLSDKDFRSYAFKGDIAFFSMNSYFDGMIMGEKEMESKNTYYGSLAMHELGHTAFYLFDEYSRTQKRNIISPSLNCWKTEEDMYIELERTTLIEGRDYSPYEGCYHNSTYIRGNNCTVMGPATGCSWSPELGPINKYWAEGLLDVMYGGDEVLS